MLLFIYEIKKNYYSTQNAVCPKSQPSASVSSECSQAPSISKFQKSNMNQKRLGTRLQIFM